VHYTGLPVPAINKCLRKNKTEIKTGYKKLSSSFSSNNF
jgi:hypothetical protein